MPDVAVSSIVMDAVHDGAHRVDLVRAHHEELVLAGDQHHIPADHRAQSALGQKLFGEVVHVGDFLVGLIGELVQRQEPLIGVETKMPCIVVGEIPGIAAVADNEHLYEAQQCPRVAVPGFILVVHDLLHGATRAYRQRLEFDLNHRNTIDENHDVVSLMAVFGIDPELVHDLEGVFAPILDIHQRIMERSAIVPLEGVPFA